MKLLFFLKEAAAEEIIFESIESQTSIKFRRIWSRVYNVIALLNTTSYYIRYIRHSVSFFSKTIKVSQVYTLCFRLHADQTSCFASVTPTFANLGLAVRKGDSRLRLSIVNDCVLNCAL